MPITKHTTIDQIIIEPETGHVLWRETSVIEEDGKELTRSYHRNSVSPAEEDFSRIPPEVEKFRVMVQTPDKKAAAKAKLAAGPKGP